MIVIGVVVVADCVINVQASYVNRVSLDEYVYNCSSVRSVKLINTAQQFTVCDVSDCLLLLLQWTHALDFHCNNIIFWSLVVHGQTLFIILYKCVALFNKCITNIVGVYEVGSSSIFVVLLLFELFIQITTELEPQFIHAYFALSILTRAQVLFRVFFLSEPAIVINCIFCFLWNNTFDWVTNMERTICDTKLFDVFLIQCHVYVYSNTWSFWSIN